MTCQPGELRLGISEDAVGRRYKGVVASYREQPHRWIICPEYGVELTAGSMKAHRRRIQRTEPAIYWNQLLVSQTEHPPQVYDVRLPKGTTPLPWTFSKCLGSYWTWNGIRNHFNWQHWVDSTRILEEHPTPFRKSDHCVSHPPPWKRKSCHYE